MLASFGACSNQSAEGEWEVAVGQMGLTEVRVAVPFANVRSAPSTTARTLWAAAQDQTFVGVGSRGDWLQVVLNSNQWGWIHRSVAVADGALRPFLHIARGSHEPVLLYCRPAGEGLVVRTDDLVDADLLGRGLRGDWVPVLAQQGRWKRVLLPNSAIGWTQSKCEEAVPFVGPHAEPGSGRLALTAYSVKIFGSHRGGLAPIDLEVVDDESVCPSRLLAAGSAVSRQACARRDQSGHLHVYIGDPNGAVVQARSISWLRELGWFPRSLLWVSIVGIGTLLGGLAGLLAAGLLVMLTFNVGGMIAIAQTSQEKGGCQHIVMTLLLGLVAVPLYICFLALEKSIEIADGIFLWWK